MTTFVDGLRREAPNAAGVLPQQHLERAIDEGVIATVGDAAGIPAENVQPASLDLRLGPVAYRLRCSFLPGRDLVERRLADLVMGEVDLTRDGAVLDQGRPYLIPLAEQLRLPPEIRARANPKSSTGRADVFTRVITDRSDTFDEIPAGYHGPLYLEVVPLSFAVLVRQGLSLNQIRLSLGGVALGDDELRAVHRAQPLVLEGGRAIPTESLAVAGGLLLGVDLSGHNRRPVGYKAKPYAPLLDLSKFHQVRHEPYWDPTYKESGDRIVLEPKHFYLLMSNEAVVIPPGLAAEMTAYDPTSGELRTHYAGFFDPGFGYDAAGESSGSTAALEVRAHDVAFMIEHGQRVCRLTFEPMLEEPKALYGEGIGSNYQGQVSTLGKHFVAPDVGRAVPAANQLELPVPSGDD